MKRKTLSQHKVRTSLQDRTLDSMFPVVNPSQQLTNNVVLGDSSADSAAHITPKTREIKESECYLTSVCNLRQAINREKHRRGSSV